MNKYEDRINIKPKSTYRRVLRWSLVVALGMIALFVLLVLLIRVPRVQQAITSYATDYFTKTTGAACEIDRLLITFKGRVWVEGFYVEDLDRDTLLYFERMEAGVAVRTLWNNHLVLNHFSISGLNARVHRNLEEDFNFQFIVDAFASEDQPNPETNATWSIDLPDVHILQTEVAYRDEQTGLNAQVKIGSLILALKPFSTDETHYDFKNLTLRGLHANIEQWETTPVDSQMDSTLKLEADSTAILVLGLNELALDAIQFNYRHRNKKIVTNISLRHHLSHGVNMLLQPTGGGMNTITVKDILQRDLNLLYSNPEKQNVTPVAPLLTENNKDPDQTSFTWPDWEIDLGSVALYHHHIRTDDPQVKETPGVFNAKKVDLVVDTLLLPGLLLKDQTLRAEINQFNAREQSGFDVKSLNFKLEADHQQINLSNFYAQTTGSKIQGDVVLTFDNPDQLIDAFEQTGFSLDLPVFRLAPEELDYFGVDLTRDTLWGPLLRYPVVAILRADGTINQFTIHQLDADLGRNLRVALKGTINSVTQPERLQFQLYDVNMVADSQDLALIIPPDSAFTLPKYIQFDGTLSGTNKRIESKFDLRIPEGELSGDLLIDQTGEALAYQGDFIIHALNASRYTGSNAPEMLTGTFKIDGKGVDPYQMVASMESEFTSMIYQGKEYSKIKVKGHIDQGVFQVDGEVDNEHVMLTLDAEGILDSLYPSFKTNVQLAHMNLQAMGISEDNMQLSTSISATGKGGNNEFAGQLNMTSLKVNREEKFYYLDSIMATLAYDNRSTTFQIVSAILNANLTANASPTIVRNGIKNHIESYMDPALPPLPISNDLTIDLAVDIPQTDFLRHILLPGLEKMEDSRLTLQFVQKDKLLNAHWSAPFIVYKESSINGFEANMVSNPDSLYFNLKMDSLISGPIDIRKTHITGQMLENRLRTNIDISDKGFGQFVNMTLDAEKIHDSILVTLSPDKLIFNNQQWDIPTDNQIVYAPKYVDVQNFEMRRGETSLILVTLPAPESAQLGVTFDRVDLEQLLAFINPEQHLASGRLNGTVTVDDLFEKPLLGANLTIDQLKALDIILGDLQAEIANNDAGVYLGDISVKGPDLDIHLDGTYDLSQEGNASYTGIMQLDKLDLSVLEPVTNKYIRNGSGLISGFVEAGNSTGKTAYKGTLNVEGIEFVALETGSLYRIPSEKVNFSNENILFDQFLISDNLGNPTILNGEINIVNLMNPAFNLNIDSKNFELLESTKENSELLYGKALLDMDLKLTGTANSPIIRSTLKLKKGTNITFVIPESEIDLVEREGVVIFEERVDGTVVSQRDTLVQQKTGYTGTDLRAEVHVDPEAIFQIVIDEQAGDKLVVSGEAILSFDMTTTGKMTLVGRYELREGYYDMRLYEIVSRRFNLQPGSKLTWSGDPVEADIDIQAIYRANTSALDLMADQLSGADASTTNTFRQELPFDVQLDMQGTLLKPIISFGIDMPQSARSALGGQVYNRIQQLDQMESEKNTQVFSLLVLGRFLPQGSSSDALTKFDASAMARTSASRMLSGQLNALSDKFIRGVDLDLDLESFTDYQSGQAEDRTKLNVRLSQSLFQDRLQVQIGGQVDLEGSSAATEQRPSDLVGDMSIEYRLTKNADWRLKAFRRNQPESLVEKQVIVNGISLLFYRDFNTFKELFHRPEKVKKQGVTSEPNSLEE